MVPSCDYLPSDVSFADTMHLMHFYFNVSYVKKIETIIEAEFHLFKLRPRHAESRGTRGVHVVEVRLDHRSRAQVLNISKTDVGNL